MAFSILADANIPCAEGAFGHTGSVRLVPGGAITPEALRGVDILLVRSVTHITPALLARSDVQFIGSATIGTDHVDLPALKERGIAFAHARGAGAEAVAEYVTAALLIAASGEDLCGKTLGVVGCGDIGSRVARRANALGMRVLRNDPPLAEASEESRAFIPLRTLLRKSDMVTLHVPLTRDGRHPTYQLIDSTALQQMKVGAWLINTSRGPVVDGAALLSALNEGRLGGAVLDVWPGEPAPDLALLARTSIATPHIAGHSFDGKLLGTRLLYQAVCDHFGLTPRWDYDKALDPGGPLILDPPPESLGAATWLDCLVRQMYDLRADDTRTRSSLLGTHAKPLAARFSALRMGYARRRAFRWYQLAADAVPARLRTTVQEGVGVRLTSE